MLYVGCEGGGGPPVALGQGFARPCEQLQSCLGRHLALSLRPPPCFGKKIHLDVILAKRVNPNTPLCIWASPSTTFAY